MTKPIRFGIIGCGEIAMATCQGIGECQHAKVEMVMDVDPNLSKDMGNRYTAASTCDLDELLANPNIDAVYVAVPHYLHKPIAIQAAQAGKHILLEKPIALNMAEAQEVSAAVEAHKVDCSIAMVRRYYPKVQKTRDLIQSGVIGDIVNIQIYSIGYKKESYWNGGYSGRSISDWRKTWKTAGGGLLIMNMYHDLDAIHFVTGLTCVEAKGYYGAYLSGVEVEDTVTAVLKYDNGAIGALMATCVAVGGSSPAGTPPTRILGNKGQIVLADDILVYTTVPSADLQINTWNKVTTPDIEHHVARRDMVDDFSLRLLQHRPSCIRVQELLNVQQTCDWIYDRNHSC